MATCGCNQTPCGCSGGSTSCEVPTPPQEPCPTLCDLDRKCNVWVEGADENGNGGICLLDTLDESDVIRSLHRSRVSHDDLLRVTSNEYLRELARTVPIYPTANEGDELQREVNHNTIPFYAVFRGQPPFAQ